jgi:ubiquinone/menaquinone biosynthesis C-methylase UbiE
MRLPNKSHYNWKYIGEKRMHSFAHQCNAVMSLQPESILEIGVGSGIVATILSKLGLTTTTLDIQPDLNPDIIASADRIPSENNSFDVILCCQVLEHLPYNDFKKCLQEFSRVAKKGCILSLPDSSRWYYGKIKLPLIGEVFVNLPSIKRSQRFPRERYSTMGHHWEIGYRESPLSKIQNDIEDSGWRIVKSWRVPELGWHRFFKLEKQ